MGITSNKYHAHISSKHSLFNLKLKETWKYRDLIWLFTKRDFVVSYKQTILGPLWVFLNPLISSIIHIFVFSGIAGIKTPGIPTTLFYLASNAIWIFFSSCLTKNASTFTANAGVFGKVYFPRLTVPISNMISSVVQFLIQMLMVVVGMILCGLSVSLGWDLSAIGLNGPLTPKWELFALLPLVLIHLGVLGLGFGLIVSSMTTKYRDLSVLVTFGVSLWMYITPVMYPISTMPEGTMQTILMYNPVTQPIELFRIILFGHGTIQFWPYAISVILTILLFVFGIMIFNKVERNFMDTV